MLALAAADLAAYLPLLAAALGLAAATLKHFDHRVLADLLEEALALEKERETGTTLDRLLAEAATSGAAQRAVRSIQARVEARPAADNQVQP